MKERIQKKADELFNKYGIRSVTMDEIATQLGMSKKTIYQIYKEKDDLVEQLCQLEMVKHECQFNEIASIAKDPIHEIMLISLRMSEMMQHINPVFFLDLQKFHPNAFLLFQKFKENCAFKDILRF